MNVDHLNLTLILLLLLFITTSNATINNDKRNNNVLSLGFDMQTGGHVFQLHLSNSPAMIDPEFITRTTGEWLKGDIYFGFNISRVFTLNNGFLPYMFSLC